MTEAEFRNKHKDDPVYSQIQDLTEEDITRVLNMTYLAERFFGKRPEWLAEKIKNHVNHDPDGGLTSTERETLRNAINLLAIELQGIADELR